MSALLFAAACGSDEVGEDSDEALGDEESEGSGDGEDDADTTTDDDDGTTTDGDTTTTGDTDSDTDSDTESDTESDTDTDTDSDSDSDSDESSDEDGGEPPIEPEFFPDQDPPDVPCAVTLGDHEELCADLPCPVVMDYVIACAGVEQVTRGPELGLSDEQVFMNFAVDHWWAKKFSFIGDADGLAHVAPFPGLRFSGQDSAGRLYRTTEELAYVHRVEGGWQYDPIPDPPGTSSGHFLVRPMVDGDDVLNFAVRRHPPADDFSGYNYYWWSPDPGDEQTWSPMGIGSADAQSGPIAYGLTADDRVFVLNSNYDYGDEAAHWISFYLPGEGPDVDVGADDSPTYPGGQPTLVPRPPRPYLGPQTPTLSVLRGRFDALTLLSIDGYEGHIESAIPGSPPLDLTCPWLPPPIEGECPGPCVETVTGREHGAHDIAQTADGRVWVSWIITTADVVHTYALVNGNCKRSSSIDATAVLHLEALTPEGASTSSVVLPLGQVAEGESHFGRDLGLGAFGERLGLVFEIARGSEREPVEALELRLLVLDTSEL